MASPSVTYDFSKIGSHVPPFQVYQDFTDIIAGLDSTTSGWDVSVKSLTTPTLTVSSSLILSYLTANTVLVADSTKAIASLGNGTADQVLGMNSGATAQEYKTIQGVANETNVAHTANTITIGLVDPLIAAKGGTGFAAYAVGDLLYADTTTTLAQRAAVATGSVFASAGLNTAAVWTNSPTLGGTLTISGGGNALAFNHATSNRAYWGLVGVAAPTFTSYSAGIKAVWYDDQTGTRAGYTTGIETSTLYQTVPTTTEQYKWYGGTTLAATLSGAGALTLVSTLTASALLATANDSGAIGASGTGFSDLFLASGGVINFNAGNVTLTHSAGLLTLSSTLTVSGTGGSKIAGSLSVNHANAPANTLDVRSTATNSSGVISVANSDISRYVSFFSGSSAGDAAFFWDSNLALRFGTATSAGGGGFAEKGRWAASGGFYVGTGGVDAGAGSGRFQGTLTADGAFGCNGTTAQTAASVGAALAAYAAGANGLSTGAAMSALHAQVVAIRAALVANGIAVT